MNVGARAKSLMAAVRKLEAAAHNPTPCLFSHNVRIPPPALTTYGSDALVKRETAVHKARKTIILRANNDNEPARS
jgi:hypothetical protein